MGVYVQKYGGSSVADVACLRRVAERVLQTQRAGHDVVVVVSAMGDTTDELIGMARELNPNPSDREMDMLLSTGEQVSIALLTMALHAQGAEAVSMTGPQAGIRTDAVHRKAKISAVEPERVFAHLAQGRIVIVAGFQGLTPTAEIATLGRGGSDTTAVALATALKAERCQFGKDVPGVFTADPRIVPRARKLAEIAYDEMLELASAGADVLQSRAVEFAKNHGVVLEVRMTFGDEPGTLVRKEVTTMEDMIVRGVAVDTDEAKVTLLRVPDQPGVAARGFKDLAQAHINVDMIVQNVSEAGHTDLSFTVGEEDLPKVRATLEGHVRELGAQGLAFDEDVAKVSIVGAGMKSHSGVAFEMFEALAAAGINIEMISTSEIKIAVIVKKNVAGEAARRLHTAFGLDAGEG